MRALTLKRSCEAKQSIERTAIMRWAKVPARRPSFSDLASWLRLGFALAVVWWLGQVAVQPAMIASVFGQEEKNPTVGDLSDVSPSAGSSESASSRGGKPVIKHRTFLDSIKAGGYIG